MSRQAVRNAADTEQVKEAARVEKDAEDVWAADLAALAAAPAGQRAFRRILTWCGLFETGLGASDAITNFRAGKREIALHLIAALTAHAPERLGVILLTPETPV